MISKKMQTALNKQFKMELDSAYLYLSMSNWAAEQNLTGFSSWMMQQYTEEMVHAMKIYTFLQENDSKVVLDVIDKPKASWKSPKDMFADTLKHEKLVSAAIDKLYGQATAEKDYRTQIFLQWFITEQIEEEATASEILEQIKAIGDKSTAIWWIDKELKKRGAQPATA